MTVHTILAAEEEAKRFLARVRVLRHEHGDLMKDPQHQFWGCKETAMVKRASMDLTRALADMRRA